MKEAKEDMELLTPQDGDEPFVVQMKLLRNDLRSDRVARDKFEFRLKIAVAIVAVFSLLSSFAWWRVEHANCQASAESRENNKTGVIEGNVTTVYEVGAAFGAEGDPRLEQAADRTRESNEEMLDKLLPPIKC